VLHCFKLESNKKVIKKIILNFEGYGVSPSGNGVLLKVWNTESSTWDNTQTGTSDGDEELSLTLESPLTDYVDSNGYVYLLARTAEPSSGGSPATINVDYAECVVTVEGICYVDVVSYRDQDDLRLKPFLWRTEFLVKSWLFEDITVT
jgi:hypothetical protein